MFLQGAETRIISSEIKTQRIDKYVRQALKEMGENLVKDIGTELRKPVMTAFQEVLLTSASET